MLPGEGGSKTRFLFLMKKRINVTKEKTTISRQKPFSFSSQDVCRQDKDMGPCVGRFKKWYYDPMRQTCKEFIFGGCEGNGNRFSSQQECESVCVVLDETALR